jgi:hypothetical protein
MEVQKLVAKAGEGRAVWLGGMGVVFKVSGAETRGAFSPRPETPTEGRNWQRSTR